jgi:hypothetical protein
VLRRRSPLERLQAQLRKTEQQLEVARAQALALREDADDLGVRSLVSDRPEDRPEAVDAERHAAATEATVRRLADQAAEIRRRIDAELDRRTGN